jgi:hypothetical protein
MAVGGWSRWARWSPLSGIVFAALWVITIIVVGDGAGDTDQEILSYYADDGNRNKEITGFFLILAAGLFYLWFLATLRSRLRPPEGEPGTGSALAFASGVVSAALLFVAAIFFSAPAFATSQDDFTLDPNTYRLISDMGYGLFVTGLTPAIVLVLATSYVVLRTRVFPVWVGWTGFPVALLLVFAFAFIPFFVFLGWVALLCILMTWWPAGAGRPATAPAGPR